MRDLVRPCHIKRDLSAAGSLVIYFLPFMSDKTDTQEHVDGTCGPTPAKLLLYNHEPAVKKKPTLNDEFEKITLPFHLTSGPSIRRMMVDTGAVLSGSAALALLHPDDFVPNDLDFYVVAHGFAGVLVFIQNHGYKIRENLFSDGYGGNPSLIIVKLVHPSSQKTINVMTGLQDHVVCMIASSHSTLVMNYVAWYGLVSLYPEWTLNRAGLIVNDTPSTTLCFEKYKDRGFTLLHDVIDLAHFTPHHICYEDPWCPCTERSLHSTSFFKAFIGGSEDLAENEPPLTWRLPLACTWKM